MKKIIATLLILCVIGISTLFAQTQIAKTATGKEVILYENGTWVYVSAVQEEAKHNIPTVAISKTNTPTQPSSTVKEIAQDVATITSIPKEYTSKWSDLIHEESPYLRRFFKTQNKILCKVQLVVTNHQPQLHTEWKVNTGEGFRYFGFVNPEKPLELQLSNGKSIKLFAPEKIYPKESEKYPISLYVVNYPLTKAQLTELLAFPITEATMQWKKKTETYKSENPKALQLLIAQLLQEK